MLRYLRIVFSAVCGIVCLLLVALWVRSYWWADVIYYRSAASTKWAAALTDGAFGVAWGKPVDELGPQPEGWTRWTTSSANRLFPREGPLLAQVFRAFDGPFPGELYVPAWFFVLVSAALASAPWIRWRYSLRTLLVVMTLVAVGLGAIVYAVR